MIDNSGWIKIHRKVLKNPFCSVDLEHLGFWISLCMLASYDEQRVISGDVSIILKPGQIITGRKKLAAVLGVKENKCERFLNVLENEQQIRQQKTNKYRIITILNWDRYQIIDSKPTANRQQTDTIKEVKKERNNTSGISSPDIANLKTELAKKMGGGISHKFQDDAFRAASYLSIDFTARPDLKGRWLSFFKTAGPRVQNTISYLVDYPPFMAIQDPEHRMRYFFEVYSK